MDEHRHDEPAERPPYDPPDALLAETAPFQQSAARVARNDQTIELKEEELFATKELREVGEVVVRTEVEEFPAHLEVDAFREEAQVEHVPVGEVVTARVEPWEENGVLVVPVYEEQLVVAKRLVLKEQLRIRRVGVTERQGFDDVLRRDRVLVEDPNNTGLVRESYPIVSDEPHPIEAKPAVPPSEQPAERTRRGESEREDSPPVSNFFKRMLM